MADEKLMMEQPAALAAARGFIKGKACLTQE
jgi:hypothetical protein